MNQIANSGTPPRSLSLVPFVRASGLRPFVDFLNSIGAPTSKLLQEARLPAGMLRDSEALLPVAASYRFLELAAHSEHLPELGEVVAWRVSAFELGSFGAALERSSRVHEYLHTGIRMIASHNGLIRFWLKAEGNGLRFHQSVAGPRGLGRSIVDVHTLVLTIEMLRRFIGDDWHPVEVALAAGTESLLSDRDFLVDARIVTGQRCTSFTLPRSVLDKPVLVPRSARTVDRLRAADLRRTVDFRLAVEELITTLVLDGYPGIEHAADALGMNPRTLQRRLGDVGATYSELLAASRFRVASKWLNQSDQTVTDIAQALGYTDGSNFARAFRRHAGMSPADYRARYAAR